MVALLVILTIVALIALDYFVFRKRQVGRELMESIEAPRIKPLSDIVRWLPGGIFLQPTYTWSRIRDDGDVVIGIHPMLFGLVGAPYQLELVAEGAHVDKGAPLARIGRDDRWLTIRSPIAGAVTQVNHRVDGEADWSGVREANGGWLYQVRPERAADEVPSWLIGERAASWTKEQYARLRNRLAGVAMGRSLGAVMADGGEIPTGVLGQLDEQAWRAVQVEFLDC